MLAHLVLAPPVLPYGHDIAAELMAHNRGMLIVGTYHAMYHTKAGSYVHEMGIKEGGKLALLASVGPMAHNRGMLRHVVGNTLVFRALYGSLVGRHAHTVGNNLYLNIVGTHLRQNDVLQRTAAGPPSMPAFRWRRC